jgi:hypothetical protein
MGDGLAAGQSQTQRRVPKWHGMGQSAAGIWGIGHSSHSIAIFANTGLTAR